MTETGLLVDCFTVLLNTSGGVQSGKAEALSAFFISFAQCLYKFTARQGKGDECFLY